PAQRVRRWENGMTVTDEPVEHRPPGGRVSERAVNENDRGTRHDWFLSSWMGDRDCWEPEPSHQATLSRWLRPRASTTLACTGATSSLAWSEPYGGRSVVRARGPPRALPQTA